MLHFIWRYKLINQSSLITTNGDPIRILDFGQLNNDAGPDFELAKVEIHNRLWVGNIELHVKSIDWQKHEHHLDPRYNSTILHVVWDNTSEERVIRMDGSIMPTLELKRYVDHTLLQQYQYLMENEQWIACQNLLYKVSELTISTWLDRLVIERLELKIKDIKLWSNIIGYDWEKIQLIALGRAFGMKVNSGAFEKLMFNINVNLLFKYSNNSFKLEALLFGSAGFLSSEKNTEDYYLDLKTEFDYLRQLHGLKSMNALEWKFLRMRPFNFPTFRLAQFIGLISKRVQWFEFMRSASLGELKESLESISTSGYWAEHFHFNKPSRRPHETFLTKDFIEHILLNAFVPVLFAYGKYVGDADLQNKAIDWLQQLHVEKNKVITSFQTCGVKVHNAADSQALLHLYKNYCEQKKCLDCAIGYSVLSR
ncbi:MAG: DUF2851 family protein [Sphingobacterium composti]